MTAAKVEDLSEFLDAVETINNGGVPREDRGPGWTRTIKAFTNTGDAVVWIALNEKRVKQAKNPVRITIEEWSKP